MCVYVGIDWSAKKRDVAIMNEAGSIIAQFVVPHQASRFEKLNRTREQVGIEAAQCLVGLETAHNLLIDYLWGQGYEQVYVIPPSVVKNSRGRYGNSGAYTDARDAHLVADLLRTDRNRFALWRPDSELVTTMKTKLAQVTKMTKLITGQTNRMRAVLWRVYPGLW